MTMTGQAIQGEAVDAAVQPIEQKLMTCMADIRAKVSFQPEIALILGSGLGDYADDIEIVETLDYDQIKGFPISTVSGHKGRFVFGYVGGKAVVIMQGRVHFYEGYPMSDVVLPTRIMGLLGAKTLILTNAAGGVNETFAPGDFMLLTDHIATAVPNPLIGPNLDKLGVRFPDMSEIYQKELREIVTETAAREDIHLKQGVYAQLTGPTYESPAEIKMLRHWGADAVGMSTACEAMAARHMGLRICGISCITNMAAGVSKQPLSHEEVKETADRVAVDFKRLITAVITAI